MSFKKYLETKNIRENKIKLKLILDEYICNRNYMFKNCETLKELRNKNENNNIDENNNNTQQIIYEINEQRNESVFIYYNDLFDDIDKSNQTFKFDTSISYGTDNNTNFSELRNYNVENYEFTTIYRENFCVSDISDGDEKIPPRSNFRGMFYNCKLLSSLPDISYWKINNNDIIDNSAMFYNCESLSSISDISYLNT